jgi:carbon monoxide dehydrogenase subunit G
MLIEGSKTIAAPRPEVWKALNDPAFLQRVIPGCRTVRALSDTELEVGLTVAVGPIRTGFDMKLQKVDVVPERSYVLRGSGAAGAAGSATGKVHVELTDVEGGTLLRYSATTELSGRIAQLGSRMIDSAARRYSEQFFAAVAVAFSQPAPGPALRPELRMEPARVAAASGGDIAAVLSGAVWKLFVACSVGTFAGAMAASVLVR